MAELQNRHNFAGVPHVEEFVNYGLVHAYEDKNKYFFKKNKKTS
jgi:hypothetical protein